MSAGSSWSSSPHFHLSRPCWPTAIPGPPPNSSLQLTEAVATKSQQLQMTMLPATLLVPLQPRDVPSPRVSSEALTHSLMPGLVSDLPLTLPLPALTVQCLLPQSLLYCQDLIRVNNFFFRNVHSGSCLSASKLSFQCQALQSVQQTFLSVN